MVQAIGEAKKRAEIYVPSRERAVFEKIKRLNEGPLPEESAHAIYREIMSAALALETEMKIAYLGPEATFTHQAARSKFGASVEYIPAATISEVFDRVQNRTADYGVVPIENSTEGAVTHTFDQFATTSLKICAEIYLPISLTLLSKVERGSAVIYSKQEGVWAVSDLVADASAGGGAFAGGEYDEGGSVGDGNRGFGGSECDGVGYVWN